MSASSTTPSAADGQPATRAIQIAIDGGAGAGKSTLGERLAQRLGYLYVDSGAFYRALTALALARGVAPDDATALVALAQSEPITIVAPTVDDGRQYTVLAAEADITHDLRTVAVERAVSQVARHPDVRRTMVAQQRSLADTLDVVMVGRDIGTVVLPNATLKIYLTASLAARAERRHADLLAAEGADAPTLEAVRADLEARDAKDAAQMRPAEDAHTLTNDHRTVDEMVEDVMTLLANAARSPEEARHDDGDHDDGDGDRGAERPTHKTANEEPPAMTTTQAESRAPAAIRAASAPTAPTKSAGKPGPVLDGTATPWFYNMMRALTYGVAPLVARLHVEGIENVPRTGPVMLAVNHIAWLDIPLVSLRIPRITHYMAKIEVFQNPILRTVWRLLGAFPVRRGEGDRESLRIAGRLLAEGEAFVIFPEGHRSGGHLIQGLPGVALIALRANTPIVPVAISGTEHALKGLRYGPFAPRVTIRYGKPFTLPQGNGRRSKADLEHGVDEIMRRIAELLPPEYRGIYADQVGELATSPGTPNEAPPATPTPADASV